MKFAAILLWLALGNAVAAQDAKSLARATVVRIWDQRVSDLHARAIEIHDRASIESLAAAIGGAPGDWQQGSFTMPTGYLTIAFWDGGQAIARFGLGEKFLVRGSMEDWQLKRISKALEKLLATHADKKPNQALQPTRMLVTFRAYARPAPSTRVADL
jgi:hypothetical protein